MLTELGPPAAGTKYFYSSAGDNLSTTMTKTGQITGTALTAKVRYEIEAEWDYAFLEASSNGTTWTQISTNLSDEAGTTTRSRRPHNQSGINATDTGITGSSGGNWVDLTATLPAGTTAIRFHYVTDGAVVELGLHGRSASPSTAP